MFFLLRPFCLALLVLLAGCASLPRENARTLVGKVIWQGEVHVRGDLLLAEGAELVIAPGTRVLFESPGPGEDIYVEHPYFRGSELIVRGTLHAAGTAEEPILFQAIDPAAPAGSWGGINIENAPQAYFSWCRFRQADSAVHARETQVRIEHSEFRNNLVGVRFHDTRLQLEYNLFEENDTAIRFHFGAPLIRHNLIRGNHKGLFISAAPRDYRIVENSFVENRPYQVSLGEGVRNNVDLRKNFWSEAQDPDLENRFFDGRIDDWLGRVEYLPRLEKPVRVGP